METLSKLSSNTLASSPDLPFLGDHLALVDERADNAFICPLKDSPQGRYCTRPSHLYCFNANEESLINMLKNTAMKINNVLT